MNSVRLLGNLTKLISRTRPALSFLSERLKASIISDARCKILAILALTIPIVPWFSIFDFYLRCRSLSHQLFDRCARECGKQRGSEIFKNLLAKTENKQNQRNRKGLRKFPSTSRGSLERDPNWNRRESFQFHFCLFTLPATWGGTLFGNYDGAIIWVEIMSLFIIKWGK